MLTALLVGFSSAKAEHPASVDLSNVSIVTSIYPPYSFSGPKGLEGVAIQRAKKILEHLKLNKPISIFPWARAYETAKTSPNTLLFSMARSAEREKLFKWVGTIVDFNVKIYKLKARKDIKVKTLEDLKRYQIGALNKDIKGNYLHSQGIPTEMLSSEETGIHMLYRGRIDMIPIDVESFKYRVEKLGYSIDKIEEVIALEDISRPLYMAFSNNTPDAVVEAFRTALESVRREVAGK